MQRFTRQKLDQQRAHLRRINGSKSRWAADGTPILLTPVRNWKEFNAPTVFGSLKARRGRCVLSHEKRLAILNTAETKAKARAAFFAELTAASQS
jgi:hypothetical protein